MPSNPDGFKSQVLDCDGADHGSSGMAGMTSRHCSCVPRARQRRRVHSSARPSPSRARCNSLQLRDDVARGARSGAHPRKCDRKESAGPRRRRRAGHTGAMQMLSTWGARVTAIARPAAFDACREAGAAEVVDCTDKRLLRFDRSFDATLNFATWDDELALVARTELFA